MPTREEAELAHVFDMIAVEYREKGLPLPEDSTAIVNARHGIRRADHLVLAHWLMAIPADQEFRD